VDAVHGSSRYFQYSRHEPGVTYKRLNGNGTSSPLRLAISECRRPNFLTCYKPLDISGHPPPPVVHFHFGVAAGDYAASSPSLLRFILHQALCHTCGPELRSHLRRTRIHWQSLSCESGQPKRRPDPAQIANVTFPSFS
jgi:hypothetical protein